jgi:hypothetical protein
VEMLFDQWKDYCGRGWRLEKTNFNYDLNMWWLNPLSCLGFWLNFGLLMLLHFL